jgi:hypothetical protein
MPDLERRMPRNAPEVLIRAEQREGMPDTQLRYERINSPYLDSGASARIA